MKVDEIISQYEKYVMPTYSRTPIVLMRGRGSKVWDAEGNEYLDFFPGWAVSGLGHSHPRVKAALTSQSKRILHVPNNYFNELQGDLAKKISAHSFDGKVFFCNSGAEANEAAIKLARAYGHPHRYEIISMENSFHGRTLATLAATHQPKYQEGFGPLPGGFERAPFGDIKALKAIVTDSTVALLIELIQGEGGINVTSQEYIKAVRELCTQRNILLICDEVQTGMGRTGTMFCYQHYGVQPDIMTLAKSLGGGIPIGAMIAKRQIADTLKPGMHASTFGGSPIVCRASLAVFEAIEKERLLQNVTTMGGRLLAQLNQLKMKHSVIREVRGMGLMIGVELTKEGKPIVEECRKRGLLINCTQDFVLRLMPALTVSRKEIDRAIKILDEVFGS